jgi:hypothetical protein
VASHRKLSIAGAKENSLIFAAGSGMEEFECVSQDWL